MNSQEHWNAIYAKKGPAEVSWYRPHLERSLRFVKLAALPKHAEILDVGGGASTFVDDLLAEGFTNVTVLDLSESAIAQSKARLGPRAAEVAWLVGDITHVDLPEQRFDFWHDRAVFHFLADETARQRYVLAVCLALKKGGHIVVATFGPSAPERCSGLPVVRYTPEGIHGQFGEQFLRVGSENETHQTPSGIEQEFVYCFCKLTE